MKYWDIKRTTFDLSPKYELTPSSPSTISSPIALLSTWTPSKPNITLYPSPATTTTPLAVAHFHKLSSSMRIGIGDPSSPNIQWTELTKSGLRGKEYHITYQPSPESPPRAFVWRRVSMWAGKDFELFDEGVEGSGKGRGGTIAKFEGKSGWTGKMGRLEIGVEMDEGMEGMVIISILGIQERIRRARNASAAAG